MSGKDKVLEAYVGRTALKLRLFADKRSALINSLILRSLALEGPTWIYELRKRVLSYAKEKRLTVPRQYTTFLRRLSEELEPKGYIYELSADTKGTEKAGRPHKGYDLTYRGSIATLLFPSVREEIRDFIKWQRPDGSARLPGLRVLSTLIEHRVAEKFWDHFIYETSRSVLIYDVEEIPDEQLYEYWVQKIAVQFAKLQVMMKTKEGFLQLRKLGVSENDVSTFERLKATDSAFRSELENILKASLQAHQELFGITSQALQQGLEALQSRIKPFSPSRKSQNTS